MHLTAQVIIHQVWIAVWSRSPYHYHVSRLPSTSITQLPKYSVVQVIAYTLSESTLFEHIPSQCKFILPNSTFAVPKDKQRVHMACLFDLTCSTAPANLVSPCACSVYLPCLPCPAVRTTIKPKEMVIQVVFSSIVYLVRSRYIYNVDCWCVLLYWVRSTAYGTLYTNTSTSGFTVTMYRGTTLVN